VRNKNSTDKNEAREVDEFIYLKWKIFVRMIVLVVQPT